MRGLAVRKAALGAAGKPGEAAPELGIMRICQHRDDPAGCGMRIASQDSVRARPSWGSSGTRTRECSPSTGGQKNGRSEEHTSELQSRLHLVCRLLLEKKKNSSQDRSPSYRLD